PPAASTAQTATLAGQAPPPAASEWEAKLIFGRPFSPPVWPKSVVTATPANTVEATSTVASPGPRNQPTVPTLSAAEIAGLLARGDWLFATGDVASARLLYERAADAGEGRAAVRLGETFDPVFGRPFSPPVWPKSVVTATPANTVEATSTVASPGPRNLSGRLPSARFARGSG